MIKTAPGSGGENGLGSQTTCAHSAARLSLAVGIWRPLAFFMPCSLTCEMGLHVANDGTCLEGYLACGHVLTFYHHRSH